MVELVLETLLQGSSCNIYRAKEYVVRDQTQYDKLLDESGLTCEHSVDFGSEMVLVVFMGRHSSGGYSINIVSATGTESSIDVVVKKTRPEKGSLRSTVITHPYHVVKLAKSQKEVKFKVE